MVLLFQGDSITDAFRKPDELNPAYNLGNGYVFLIAARLITSRPDFRFLNRGISGNGVKDLLARLEQDALVHKPDVFTILIGINDTISAMSGGLQSDSGDFAANYHQILSRTHASLPDTRLILMEPFLLDVGDVTPDWRTHLAGHQTVVRKLAKEYGAHHIPLQELFDEACSRAPASHWAYDGIHPTHAGFELIAGAWIKAFAE